MGSALKLSLIGHAAVIISFLLLSTTRPPLRIAEVARPIRLVTYLETPAPSVARAPRVAEPAPPRPAAERPAAEPVRAAEPPPAPIAVPRIAIPTREPAAAPVARPATARPEPATALQERLSRRLAAAAPAAPRPAGEDAPQLASLPPPEPVPVLRDVPAMPAAAFPPGGVVVPVGSFPHAWYLALLKERVYAVWAPPSEFFSGSRSATALISFRIDRAGRISRAAIKQGSGSARFDQSALVAVQGLRQVPALPQQYAEETLDVVIRFQQE